jgi:hypothetical protein
VQIASRIRSLLDDTTAVRSRASVTDAFFGEREGLGISLAPSGPPSHPAGTHSNFPGGAARSPADPFGSARGGASDAVPSSLSVPMLKRPGWIAPALVAATALLAGVVLALLFV